MRAFQIHADAQGSVIDSPEPRARSGEVIVATSRAGICGTDVGLFVGGRDRLRSARTQYPLQPGHEWSGVVVEVGVDVDPGLVGQRVTGDTMIGCGHCDLCLRGLHHVCADRYEIGVRRGWPGAFCERFPVPTTSLRHLPDSVDDLAGAMVEPGGNAARAVAAALERDPNRTLIIGAGTIGLLSALFARAAGADVTLLARRQESVEFAAQLGITATSERSTVDGARWGAVIDCTDAAEMPSIALELVEPTGRVVLMGVSHAPSTIDTRVALRKEASLVGILGASAGLQTAIEAYATGAVDPRPLVAETIGLDQIADELAGRRSQSGPRPKIQVDPSLG